MEGFVPVATFSSELEADLAIATLAAAGIESYLKFDDAGGMMSVFQHTRGVQLLVAKEDLEEAATVLSTPPSEPPPLP